MYKMIINNNTDEIIEISSFFRRLDWNDTNVFFHIDISFNGDYSSNSIDFLAKYAKEEITNIEIMNTDDEIILTISGKKIQLNNLYEGYDNNNKNGNATLEVFLNN